jgi:hypothetical protein
MIDAEKRLEFLREIHRIKSENYDNSMSIPTILKDKYATSVNTDGEWHDYLDFKFRFLMQPTKDHKAIQQFTSQMSTRRRGYLEEFINDWSAKEAEERITYQYRLAQIARDEVHRRWYCTQIDECDQWCRNAEMEMAAWLGSSLAKKWSTTVQDIWQKIANLPAASLQQDYVLSEVCRRGLQPHTLEINEIHDYLSKGPLNLCESGKLAEKCQTILDNIEQHFKQSPNIDTNMNPNESNFLVRLSVELTGALYDENFDETALITRFLSILKEQFKCEVCDYLDALQDERKIVWRTATVNHKDLSEKYRGLIESGKEEEWRREILSRESYGEGIGISGSVLLLKKNTGRNIWFHVGSNDVSNDPRQSREHRHAYQEDMYPGVLKENKLIDNFWIFPVYKHSNLVGAFRVVNKLTSEGRLQGGGWDYSTRVQLALIADWFSKFLEAVEPQIQRKEDFKALWMFSKGIDELITKLDLTWISKGVLAGALRHLRTVKLRKVEKRQLGCCVIIVKNSAARAVPELEPYPLLDVDYGTLKPLFHGVDRYYDPVDPSKGAFVFDENGVIQRVVKLQHIGDEKRTHDGFSSLEQITKHHLNSVCFALPRDTRNILVYCHGLRAAEIRVSEIAGEYQFRYPRDILDMMKTAAPNRDLDIVTTICDTALELSYRGYGGIIVFGEVPYNELGLTQTILNKPNQNAQDIGKDFLAEFVKLDGATFVQSDGIVVRVNTTVSVPGYKLPRKLFLERAARHEIGEKISNVAPESLVIIVSENGGISLVKGGSIVSYEGKKAENL